MTTSAPSLRIPARTPNAAPPVSGRAGAAVAPRSAVLIPFLLFAVYGLVRWQTLLEPNMRPRLAGLLLLAMLVAAVIVRPQSLGLRGSPLKISAVWAAVVTVGALIVLLVMIAVAGLPLSWVLELRLGTIVHAIGAGIGALPALKVPYIGDSRATRSVIVLAAGVLLLIAALVLDGAITDPRHDPAAAADVSAPPVRQRRLMLAAVPLLVLAMLPSVVRASRFSGLHGALSCGFMIVLVCGWRLRPRRVMPAVLMLAACGAVAALVVHEVRLRHGLLSVTKVVSSLKGAHATAFNWSQSYGPLGRAADNVVLRVKAAHPAYWKAEDLDLFNGFVWMQAPPTTTGAGTTAGGAARLPGVSHATIRRWTQTLHVTDVGMRSDEVIAAGTAQPPHPLRGVAPGAEPGTWTLSSSMRPHSSYRVNVYTPTPSNQQLGHAGDAYPTSVTRSDLTVGLPAQRWGQSIQYIRFAKYGDQAPFATTLTNAGGAEMVPQNTPTDQATLTRLLNRSALGPVYALAMRLKTGTTTPYQYVQAVDSYLHHGFTYVRTPRRRANPIPAFLLQTKRGYCQQFAGGMALLLRMGGVPARVAAGFETGTYSSARHSYAVTGEDAHAWVEAWFPGYGWVTLDPTPEEPSGSQASNRGFSISSSQGVVPASIAGAAKRTRTDATHARRRDHLAAARTQPSSAGGPADGTVIAAIAGACVIVLLSSFGIARVAWRERRRRRGAEPERSVTELECAFRRCRKQLQPGATLVQLESLLRDSSPDAAGYVRAVRLARFGGSAELPSRAQRRALRAWFAHGGGLAGRLRALVALPPRFVD